ncbi:HEAT repeat domain-containing protein [Tahibacter amnicola]|uniref:HEAT repeat domain-containing protein n=1 Tax=Tahibacter amnicola TaxID=2976241 RepID=A0ABY6BES3_9GAMM|nr:HEAT repeat domain-containing protein [Tahibacter amnicola]UXI68539.1 HEAT repeat domain-containing protein [Tahibacter amnicola]
MDPIEGSVLQGFPQPEWNRQDSISAAIVAAHSVKDGEEIRTAARKLLGTVANDHRGTYYPVILPVLPIFERVLESDNGIAKQIVLGTLGNIVDCFQPEDGYEEFLMPDGKTIRLHDEFMRVVKGMIPLIKRISHESTVAGAMAREILSDFAEGN